MEQKQFKGKQTLTRIFFETREIGVIVPLVVFFIFFALRNPNFYSKINLMNMLRNSSFTLIGAVGMTLLLITGNFDMAAGSELALGGVVTSLALVAGMNVPVAIILGLLSAVAAGAFMGFFTVTINIPCFISGMGVMYILKGILLLITMGQPVFPLPDAFTSLSRVEFLGCPLVMVVAIVFAILGHILLKYTVFGRKVFACGGNIETARLSGIRTNRVLFACHMLSAVCMATSGILTAARLSSGQPTAGADYNMTTIAACVIGGVSLFGGAGTIMGAVLGSFFMTMLTNGMTITGISPYYQQLILGVVVLVSVGFDQFRKSRKL